MEKEINENIIEIEGKKYKFIEAEKSICCRSCDLRKDEKCHLLHRMCISDNRKDKKEGYFKRIEDTTFDLENYTPKGDLKGFPKEIIARMLECQEEQGNPRDVSVFEKLIAAKQCNKGFEWDDTKEGWDFWHDVITNKNFNLFFEKYPKQEYQELKNNKNMQENNKKQDNSQKFKVGDEVIYFISNKIGIVREVKNHKFDYDIDIVVDFGNNDICEYEISSDIERPFLLHYRDDYNYDVIDFNNLPKRQDKRWRAKVRGKYYSFTSKFKVEDFYDTKRFLDNEAYKLGNYFKTKEEAQEMADKLNKCFQELI